MHAHHTPMLLVAFSLFTATMSACLDRGEMDPVERQSGAGLDFDQCMDASVAWAIQVYDCQDVEYTVGQLESLCTLSETPESRWTYCIDELTAEAECMEQAGCGAIEADCAAAREASFACLGQIPAAYAGPDTIQAEILDGRPLRVDDVRLREIRPLR